MRTPPFASGSPNVAAAAIEPFHDYVASFVHDWSSRQHGVRTAHEETRRFYEGLLDVLEDNRGLVVALIAARSFDDPDGRLLDVGADPDPGPLRRELLAELARRGPRTVTELRRHTLTSTVYRAVDAGRAVTGLLDEGVATRDPEHGRLGGDVLIAAATRSAV